MYIFSGVEDRSGFTLMTPESCHPDPGTAHVLVARAEVHKILGYGHWSNIASYIQDDSFKRREILDYLC